MTIPRCQPSPAPEATSAEGASSAPRRTMRRLQIDGIASRLIELGAQLFIVPTMDVVDWGVRQHALDARVAPVRAAEYGIPIFRVASSGISQLVDAHGDTVASAPCPGDGATLSGVVEIRNKGHLPFDRWLALFATVVTSAAILLALIRRQSVIRTPAVPLI